MMTSIEERGHPHRKPNGFVLPAVLLATVVLTVGASAALMVALDERTASRAVLDSGAARFAAEAGIALALKDFPIDSVAATLAPGEKYEFDWWYHPDVSSFRPTLLRCDDGAGEPMYALTVEGRSSQQVAGATRNVRLMLSGGGGPSASGGGGGGDWPTGAVVVEGPISVTGVVILSGACADLHTNSQMKMGATLTTDGVVSASGSLAYDQLMLSSDGSMVSPESTAPVRDIPTLDPSSFCGDADFFFRNQWVIEAATGDSINASVTVTHGWQYELGVYTATGLVSSGTVCADGNVRIKDVGLPGNPLQLTVLTQGSIRLRNTAYLTADHGSGVVMMAAGDISITGESGVVGILYAGSQCELNGTISITGQLLCRGLANPPGSEIWADINELGGYIAITYACPTSEYLEPLSTRASREVW